MKQTTDAPFAVCFSGHRPEKLPAGTLLHILQSLVYTEIRIAVMQGADRFYCGMAQGTDLFAADVVLAFRRTHPNLRLIAVRPFPAQGAGLTGDALYHYRAVLHEADEIVTVCPSFSKDAFRRRNLYMVSHAQRLIALLTDPRSGTGQTVRMAERMGLDVRRISPECAAYHKPEHRFFR